MTFRLIGGLDTNLIFTNMKTLRIGIQTAFKMLKDTFSRMKSSFMDFWNSFKQSSWKKILVDVCFGIIIVLLFRPVAIALSTVAFVNDFNDVVIGTIVSVAIGSIAVLASIWAAELLIIPVAITIAQLTRMFINNFNEAMQADPA